MSPLDEKTCNWYKGPTLMEILDSIEMEPRFSNGLLRIPILDKTKDNKDRGLIVNGKVENGTVKLGDLLTIMPQGSLA